MQGYLLDTNHIQAFFNKEQAFVNRFKELPPGRGLYVCDKTLEEIENGHRITVTTNQKQRDKFIVWAKEIFTHYTIDSTQHTIVKHDEIIDQILQKHPCPPTSMPLAKFLQSLGVHDYDVWAVSVAWERNITLLTQDKMAYIREAVGSEVRFENWR